MEKLFLGIDIGSTTFKAVLMTESGKVRHSMYQRTKPVDSGRVRCTGACGHCGACNFGQLKETVDFLYENGAKAVHMRSACPPIMYGCKYLNFSRSVSDMDLIARRIIMELEGEEGFKHIDEYTDGSTQRGKNLRDTICKKFNFTTLEFQSLEGIIKAIGIDKHKLCTYCWNGKG